jgi:ATP-dependent DNA ligase
VLSSFGNHKLLAKTSAGIQFVDHLAGDGAEIFAHACRLGCEGIVSKHNERARTGGVVILSHFREKRP